MLDVMYYKDYRHNYLIIKNNGGLTENVYQRKMVTENKIKGLLVSQERHINGEILLYYEITSKQSLSSIYDGKSIGMKQLCNFFVQLKVVNDMLQKYLLDGNCLLLSPEYIFQDVETGEYSFLYYPDANENGFSGLMDFFMGGVDGEDVEAVETVYKIADLMNREQFVLDEVLKWFQDDVVKGEESNRTDFSKILLSDETKYKTKCNEKNGELYETPVSGADAAKENLYKNTNENTHNSAFNNTDNNVYGNTYKSKRSLKKMLAVLGASGVGSGFLIYVMYFYPLSYEEEIYLTGGLILLGIMALCAVIWYFYPLLHNRKNEQEQEGAGEERYYMPTYENDEPAPAPDMGNTVFIPWTENCENKLYSMDKKIKCHIDLGKLPLTVGKLAGAVDMVIDEKSISRMHAKFFRDGNRIYISDLNSTNGTFRNGMRLMPNASEIIEPGDEIRLGKLKFIYR